jgi:hypothetical protein
MFVGYQVMTSAEHDQGLGVFAWDYRIHVWHTHSYKKGVVIAPEHQTDHPDIYLHL